MRAQRLVAELGPRELAMTRPEAARLLADAGHELDRDTLDLLLQRTEGWPVALALAALYLGDGGSRPNLARFDGSDRLVADYVRDEAARRPAGRGCMSFAVRTCVADTLTSSLCDALVGPRRLGLRPRGARAGRPRDPRRPDRASGTAITGWSATRCGPSSGASRSWSPSLHRRASAWHRAAGDVDRAVLHSLAAGDVRVAEDLVWASVAAPVAEGQPVAAERWLGMFSESQISRHPRLALVAAGFELVRGQGHLVDHWATTASDAPQPAASRRRHPRRASRSCAPPPPPEGSPGCARTRVRPASCCARRAAPRARSPASSRASRTISWETGERATRRLAEGARHAAVLAPHVHALCLAQLAAVAFERDDWDELTELSARARGQAEHHGLRDAPTSALVFAVAALARAHRGRIEEARDDLERATALLAGTTDFAAWYGAEVHILLARAALRLSDVCRARTHVRRAARLLRHVPEAVALAGWLSEAQAQLAAFTPPESAQPSPMTAAELRVLRFLPTHLSFREIAERTQVSANTVKTQANAVYRKFGVACRSDAVTRARSCGLLD